MNPDPHVAWIVMAFLAGSIPRFFERRGHHQLELPSRRFWEIVARDAAPLVVITMRGFLRRRLCYQYPYHGIVFFTWSRPEQLPPGTKLVSTADDL